MCFNSATLGRCDREFFEKFVLWIKIRQIIENGEYTR